MCSRLCPPEAFSGNEALTPPAIRIVACWWPWPNSSPRMTYYQRKLTYPSLCTYHLHAVTDWCGIAKACPLCLSSGHFCKVIPAQSFLELDDVNMKPYCQSCLLHPTPRVVSKSGHLHANLCVKVSQRTLYNIESKLRSFFFSPQFQSFLLLEFQILKTDSKAIIQWFR